MVPSWLVAEYKTLYADTSVAWRFRAMFSDGLISFMFDLRRSSERSSRYGYLCVGAAMDLFAERVSWHAEELLRVRYADRASHSRGVLPSPFKMPRAEC